VSGPEDDEGGGAVVEPVYYGTTSGLTALDRARRGNAGSVRVLVAGSDGGRAAELARAIGYTVTVVDAGALADENSARHYHVGLIDAVNLGPAAADALEVFLNATPPTPAIVVDGSGDETRARVWLESGADDHLAREALGGSVLRRAIEAAVARSRARELRRRLEHADRLAAIGTLAAGVAHEVNNPAAYVLMNLKTCREHVADLRRSLEAGDDQPCDASTMFDEMQEMLEDNVRGVERIVDIVHALRSYARSDPDEIDQVDVAAVCRDAFDLVGNQLRHRARLALDLAPVPPIAADARKLSQVVINLLVNAADAIPRGDSRHHEIRMRCFERGGRVELSVSDTGVGVPPAHRDRIFEPFFTTKPRGEGSGLGLAIVRDIVERFGGKLAVESEVGKGSTFIVVFPVDNRAATRRTPAPQPRSSTRARVLIVDDEIALTSALRRQLRGHHEVTVINDGAAGLAAILRQDFDVILCDVMMPGTDGLAVLEALRKSRPDLVHKVVLMTAGVFADPIRERVAALGGQLLDKPVPLETLLAMIESVRSRRRRSTTNVDAAVPTAIE